MKKSLHSSKIHETYNINVITHIHKNRFPIAVLLEEAGVSATGDLSTFTSIGNAKEIAKLLNLRREREKPGQSRTKILDDSIKVSNDGKTLQFQLRAEIDVNKPDLLLEQIGLSELYRITLARAELHSNDGQLMACYASAMGQDYEGPDGESIRQVISSFTVKDQSSKDSSI